MGFAGAAVAHEDQVLPFVQVTPLGQIQDPGLVEGGQRREVELVQGLEHGKPGHPEPLLVGVLLPLWGFDLHQGQQEGLVREIPLGGLAGQFLVMATDGREPQPLEISLKEHAFFHSSPPYRLTSRSKWSTRLGHTREATLRFGRSSPLRKVLTAS